MNVTMPPISLDPRLQQDTVLLGYFEESLLLLMRNALYPWFVIVPNSNETELYQLPEPLQAEVMRQVNMVSRFISQAFAIDKLNIGAIGNIVSQLHIHVVGRCRNDECWPGVVWGGQPYIGYTNDQIIDIKDKLGKFMLEDLTLAE